MNRLQRHNQRVVVKALGKPLLVMSIDVGGGRLIGVQTATWEEYWDGCDCVAEEIRCSRGAWSALIETGYSVGRRTPAASSPLAVAVQKRHGLLPVLLVRLFPGDQDRPGWRSAWHRRMDDRYVQVLHRLGKLPSDHPRRALFDAKGHPPLRVECSLAFFHDEHRRLLDPAAPTVESRMEALRFLRKEELPVFVRIDPLFPRDPLGGGKTMADFGLPDVQWLRDLEGLVRFSRELATKHIIYSVAKITRPKRGALPPVMERMKRVYQHLSAGQPVVFHGGSWRLPESAATPLVVKPFLELYRRYSMPAKPCRTNLITTP
jgi:hypothetical protein